MSHFLWHLFICPFCWVNCYHGYYWNFSLKLFQMLLFCYGNIKHEHVIYLNLLLAYCGIYLLFKSSYGNNFSIIFTIFSHLLLPLWIFAAIMDFLNCCFPLFTIPCALAFKWTLNDIPVLSRGKAVCFYIRVGNKKIQIYIYSILPG